MRTFYISIALFIALVVWLLNKPMPNPPQVVHEFTEREIVYLEKSFDYSMDNLEEGEHLDWSTGAVNGRISVGPVFTSGEKAKCRNYVEIARTHEAQRTESGIACERQSAHGGWCRLRANAPQSCALENIESPAAKRARYAIMQGSQAIDRAMGNRVSTSGDGLAPPTPTVSPLNAPRMPEVDKPDISLRDFRPTMPWESK